MAQECMDIFEKKKLPSTAGVEQVMIPLQLDYFLH